MQALDAETAILVETVRAALEWCRATVERLYAEGMELRARRRREEAAEKFRDVRMIAWSATELVAWTTPWDSWARKLLRAVHEVRQLCPRMHSGRTRRRKNGKRQGKDEKTKVVFVDHHVLLQVLSNMPDDSAEIDVGNEDSYRLWDAFCQVAGLTHREAEAVLLVKVLGYSIPEAARLIGVKPSSLSWHLAGGEHKLNKFLEGDAVGVAG